jgi:hypothetical protein
MGQTWLERSKAIVGMGIGDSRVPKFFKLLRMFLVDLTCSTGPGGSKHDFGCCL